MTTKNLRTAGRGNTVGLKSPPKRAGMGKKLRARNAKVSKDGLRGQFTLRFRAATAGKTPVEIAALLGCSSDMARKYLRGDRVPEWDTLPEIAKALGLRHWTDLFDPKS